MKSNSWLAVFVCVIVATFIVRFWFAFHWNGDPGLSSKIGEKVELSGVIIDEPDTREQNQKIVFQPNAAKSSIMITAPLYPKLSYGDEIKVIGILTLPRNFKSETGREFDYVHYLSKDDIFQEIKKPISITKTDSRKGSVIKEKLFSIKYVFLESIQKVLGEPHSSLAGGLVVGEKQSLGKELIDDFRKSGLIHIVVLSGFNITIVADTISKLLAFLPRTIALSSGAFAMVLFGVLVGGGATVVRSVVMALFAVGGKLLYREYNVTRALFLAGCGMVFHNPLILLYDPSFQLSFLATLGLIVFAKPIEDKLTWITERFGIRSLIASTCATQLFVGPFILYIMGQMSIVGVLVNILVLPFIPITMLFVALTGGVGIFSELLSWIPAVGSHILLSYELWMVTKFAALPFAAFEIPMFAEWIVWVTYVFYMLFWWRSIDKSKKEYSVIPSLDTTSNRSLKV